MSTLRQLAAEHGFQTYELAAYLDLGADYDETAELEPDTEDEYRQIIATGAAVQAEQFDPPEPQPERLTGGELQTIREYLGLTGDALAGFLGVNPRTLRSWEQGRELVPVRVRAEVAELERMTDDAVELLVAVLQRDPGIVVYRTDAEMVAARPDLAHMSARWWRHVVARARRQVPDAVVGNTDEI